jgi:hypothetical protein
MSRRIKTRALRRWQALACSCALGWCTATSSKSAAQANHELDTLDDTQPAAAAEEGPSSEAEVTAQEAPAPQSAKPSAAQPTAASVLIQPFAGIGWASRSFERPTKSGPQALATAFAPALEVGLGVVAWPDDAFSLSVTLHYQTALGLTVTELPPFALQNEVHVRSERLSLSVAPTWRLGSSSRAPRLAIPLGATVRTFWPGAHELMTPGYSLVGPHARIELIASLTGPITLIIGPEVQWIIAIDDRIKREGVSSQGLAIGGQLSLNLELSAAWSLALHYRESHAFADAVGSVSFKDVERYMTLRIVGTF